MSKHLFAGMLWLLLLPFAVLEDLAEARWLPWWRRGWPSVCMAAVCITSFLGAEDLNNWFWWGWFLSHLGNRYTAHKNRRDSNDHQKREAESARLTEVQQSAFNRQVAESHG